jgi:hypothetical protein
MPKPGTYSAYQQSTPIAEDFGGNMIQAENQQSRYRAEKRQEEQVAYQKKKDRLDNLQKDYDKMKYVATGIKSVDEANSLLYHKGMKQLGEINRQLDNPNLTADQERELLHKKNMVTNSPEYMEAASKRMTEYVDATTKGIAEGTISKWDMYELENIEPHYDMQGDKGVVFDYDEQGLPVGHILRADGEMVKMSYADVVNGYKLGANTANIDKGSWVENQVKNLGKLQQVKYENGMIGVAQTVEGHISYINEEVANALGTAEDPTDLAKSIWVDTMGKSPKEFDESSIETIKNNLVNSIKAGYDETFNGSQVRPTNVDSDDRTSTEKRDEKRASALYKTAQGIVNLDPEYIRGVSSYTKKDGDKSIALGSPQYLEGSNELVFVDKDGAEIQRVSLNDKEAAAREIAKIISGKESVVDVVGDYEFGKELNEKDGGITLSGKKVAPATEEEVVDLPGIEIFDAMENQGNPEAIATTLKKAFVDQPFKISHSNWRDSVTIIAGGVKKEFKIGDEDNPRPEALAEIKAFLKSKAKKTKKYVTKEESSNKSNGGKRMFDVVE